MESGELSARPENDDLPESRNAVVDAAVAGDPVAVRKLLEQLAPEVVRVVRAILGPFDMGQQDAVQDALLAFVHALPSFRRDCSAGHFARRIAARTALSAARRQRAQRPRDSALVRETAYVSGQQDLERRRRAFVRKMFDELPEAQANVIALRFLLGCSLEETAQAVDAPVNTVRSRIRLAKEAMRKYLAKDPALLLPSVRHS